MKTLQDLMDAVSEWGDKTFDNGFHTPKRSIAVSYHLQKEAKELTEALESFYKNPNCENSIKLKHEFADNLILLVQAAKLCGFDEIQLVNSGFEKLEICKGRKWGKPDSNGVIQHIHEDETIN